MRLFEFTKKTKSAVLQIDGENQIPVNGFYVPVVIMPDNVKIGFRPLNTIEGLTKVKSININYDTVIIDGVTSTATTAKELYDEIEPLFFLGQGEGGGGDFPNPEQAAATLSHFIYNPVTDRLEADRPIETTLSSLYLGNHHRMSSGGENVYFTNESYNINWYPMWGGLKDMNDPLNKGQDGVIKPSARNFFNFSVIELNGPVATGVTDSINQAVIALNVCGVGVTIVIEDTIIPTDKLIYKLWYGTDDSGEQVFESIKRDLTFAPGDSYEWIYEHPVDTKANQAIYARIDVESEDGSTRVLQVRKSVTGDMWLSLQAFQFTDDDLAYKSDLQDVSVNTDATISGDGTASSPLSVVGTTEGGIRIVGYWNADTNTPDLSTITLEQGEAYQVSVGGTSNLNGYTEWNEFDLALWIDTIPGNWFRVVSTEKVLSVNGKKGEVVIDKDDIGLGQVDNTSDQDKPVSIATQTLLNTKVNIGGDISDLNNDSEYISTVSVDNTTVFGNGVDIPLSSVGRTIPDSFVIKTNILDNILITPSTTGQYAQLDCIGSLDFSEGTGWGLDNQGITVPQDGTYEVSFSIHFGSSGQRSTPVVSISIDGVIIGDESNNAYIRNSASINSDSCILTTIIEASQGEKISIQARREGTVSNSTRTISNGSFIAIKKISNSTNNEGASSLNDLTDVDLSVPPEFNQILKFNGNTFTPSDESGGGGNVEVIDKEVAITQTSWSGNTNNVYNNIPVDGVEVGQLCIISPNPQIWQIIQANGATWDGYAYCISPNLVIAVCRVSSFIGIPPLSTFNIKVIESVSNLRNLFVSPIRTEIEVLNNTFSLDTEHHDKQITIKSPLDYSILLPPLDTVDTLSIYKFKNLNDSTVKGSFIPLVDEEIEGLSNFEFFGKGTLSLRKKSNSNGSYWSIIEISNLFDYVGQGKSKEVSFNNNNGTLEIAHDRGYRPIVKVYLEDGYGGHSDVDVDIDHNTDLNSFIVNLQGNNSGFIRYI